MTVVLIILSIAIPALLGLYFIVQAFGLRVARLIEVDTTIKVAASVALLYTGAL